MGDTERVTAIELTNAERVATASALESALNAFDMLIRGANQKPNDPESTGYLVALARMRSPLLKSAIAKITKGL